MKMKWITAAVLASSGTAAFAQSSVTLYGVLDSGILYQSTSAASFSPNAKNLGAMYRYKDAGLNASSFGMRGTEDLGGRLYANFRLEGAFDSGTGKSGLGDTAGVQSLFNKVATVGLSGAFGSINAGRQYAPMAKAMASTDVRSGQYFGSVLTAWIGMNQAAGWQGTSTNGPIGALYDSNAIVYETPVFGGASAAFEYAPGGVAGSFQAGTRESVVLKYVNYGLKLSGVYYNGHDTNPAANAVLTGLDNNRFVYVGALYTIRGLSFSASYSNGKNPAHSNQTDIDMYTAGLGYQFRPDFDVTSGLYYLKDNNKSSNRSMEIAVGAHYSLSKTTSVYAQGGYVNNRGKMAQTISYGQPVAPGVSTTAVMLGVHHNF